MRRTSNGAVPACGGAHQSNWYHSGGCPFAKTYAADLINRHVLRGIRNEPTTNEWPISNPGRSTVSPRTREVAWTNAIPSADAPAAGAGERSTKLRRCPREPPLGRIPRLVTPTRQSHDHVVRRHHPGIVDMKAESDEASPEFARAIDGWPNMTGLERECGVGADAREPNRSRDTGAPLAWSPQSQVVAKLSVLVAWDEGRSAGDCDKKHVTASDRGLLDARSGRQVAGQRSQHPGRPLGQAACSRHGQVVNFWRPAYHRSHRP